MWVPTVMDVSTFLQSSQDVWTSLSIPNGSTVGIVDSSFNPPNFAHVKLAHLCRVSFNDCYIVFLLGTGNADKPSVSTDELRNRIEMINLMIDGEFPNDARVGWGLTTKSKFVDKAEAVTRNRDVNAIFAMGFDTLVRLGDQRFYTEPVKEVLSHLFEKVCVLVLTRDEDGISKTPDIKNTSSQVRFLPNSVFAPYVNRIYVHVSREDTYGISSTLARRSVQDLRRAAPRAVADYVVAHDLYNIKEN